MRGQSEQDRLFAERLRKIRDYRGLSCQRLADLVGLDRRVLSKIENNDRSVTVGEAIVIANGLGVDLLAMCSPEPMTMRVDTTID